MPFCKECYYSCFGSTCFGCKKKIHGGVMKAAGQTWHKECFVCSDCNSPLEARFATRDGKPLCGGCCEIPTPSKAACKPVPRGKACPPNSTLPKAGARKTPSPAMIGSRGKSPPPAKSGTLPKIGIGRGGVAAAPSKSIASAKKAVMALSMDYSDL
jgi:hypothetical protein